jgi:rubrerythrin
MVESAAEAAPTAGTETDLAAFRLEYVREGSGLVGSVPPPATVMGALKSGAKMLGGKRPQFFMDKIGERLAFERTGVRFYEALILKHAARAGESGAATEAKLMAIRDEELRHFAVLFQALETLGADPTVQTPWADVAAVESSGLMSVIMDPRTTFAQSLHAVLIGELADNAGWENLIEIAEAENQPQMASAFRECLHREQEHLGTVRHWLDDLTLGESRTGVAARAEPH